MDEEAILEELGTMLRRERPFSNGDMTCLAADVTPAGFVHAVFTVRGDQTLRGLSRSWHEYQQSCDPADIGACVGELWIDLDSGAWMDDVVGHAGVLWGGDAVDDPDLR